MPSSKSYVTPGPGAAVITRPSPRLPWASATAGAFSSAFPRFFLAAAKSKLARLLLATRFQEYLCVTSAATASGIVHSALPSLISKSFYHMRDGTLPQPPLASAEGSSCCMCMSHNASNWMGLQCKLHE